MKQWTPFIKGIIECENLADWSRLWDDFIQKELQDGELNGGWHKNDDDNLDLTSLEKKGMFKNITIGESTSQYNKKKKMRKVKSFESHQFGNYEEQCLNKNKGGNEMQLEVVALTKNQIDEFCEKFE